MEITTTRATNGKAARPADIFQQAAAAAFNPGKYRKKQKPRYARFKMKIFFRDGNSTTMYSYDWNKDYSTGVKKYRDDEQLGFTKLLLYLDKQRTADTINSAFIYMTMSLRKDTECQDYDVLVATLERSTRYHFNSDHRLKYCKNNKVMLQLFQEGGQNV